MTAPNPQHGDSVLSVRQPFAWLIVQGIKRIENRSRATRYRGPLYIHASAGPQVLRNGWHEIVSGKPVPLTKSVRVGKIELPPLLSLPRSVILGRVDLFDCQRYDELPKRLQDEPFAEPGSYCWLLDNAQVLAEPIRDLGKLGIWKYQTSNGLSFL